MAQDISNSHLLKAGGSKADLGKDKRSLRKMKDDHLNSLQKMIADKTVRISPGQVKKIRDSDLPTEYVVLFAFAFIATIGGLVGWQVKKGSSALPLASRDKRLD